MNDDMMGALQLNKNIKKSLFNDFGSVIIRDEYRGQDMIPMREVYRLEQRCERAEEKLAREMDARSLDALKFKAELTAAARPERDAVVKCAMIYVKVQSSRYQRELEEAIDAMERTKR